MSKVRLSLDVSPEMNAQIEGLMSTLCCTKSDALRKAVALLAIAVEAEGRGEKVALAKDERLVSLIIL